MLVFRPEPMCSYARASPRPSACGAGRWRSLSEASEGFPDSHELTALQ
jgi:hypothetical protein